MDGVGDRGVNQEPLVWGEAGVRDGPPEVACRDVLPQLELVLHLSGRQDWGGFRAAEPLALAEWRWRVGRQPSGAGRLEAAGGG